MSPVLPETWLAVRLGAMGDVLLASGVLDWWRKTRGMRFRVLTKAPWAGLLENHPAVEEVIPLQREDLGLRPFAALARRLADESRGQGLLDLHDTPRSRLLSLLWRGPVRRYPKMALERRLYSRLRLASLGRRLEALNVPQRYALALESDIAKIPAPGELAPLMRLRPEELAWARERLGPLQAGGPPLVAMHPFAAHAAKAWPVSHWLQLLQGLREAGLRGYFIGQGRLPEALTRPDAGAAGSFVNAATPRQSAALLALSGALVTGDSGPMHLGVAAGAPVVALFGPTARVWGFCPPPPHRVLELDMACRPCSLHGAGHCSRGVACMQDISPARVLEAVLEKRRPAVP